MTPNDPIDVEIPGDLAAALEGEPLAGEVFERLAATPRKKYVQWVEEAPDPEARERRVTEVVERMVRGEATP